MLKASGSSVSLSEYVNQKVEVTGTMDSAAGHMTSTGSTATTPSGSTAGTTGTGTTGTTGAGTTGTTGATASGSSMGASAMPTFNVTNVKVVSKTCS